jgi:hypothetical protein
MQKAVGCAMLAALTVNGQTFNQPFDQVNPQSSRPASVAPRPASVAETITKMRSILMAMKSRSKPGDLLNQQLADSMLALALPERQPTRAKIVAFTAELSNALSGMSFNDEQDTILQQCIVDVMRAGNVTNYQLARRLRKTLTAVGADGPNTDLVIRNFVAVGEAVRGPDDQVFCERLQSSPLASP